MLLVFGMMFEFNEFMFFVVFDILYFFVLDDEGSIEPFPAAVVVATMVPAPAVTAPPVLLIAAVLTTSEF